MLKTPPAFFTMSLVANMIFPKKNSNNCNLVLNQSNCNCFFFSPTKMNLATFIFICCESHFFGGGTPVKEFSQIQLFTTRILLEKIYHFLSILVSRDVFFKHYLYGHFET